MSQNDEFENIRDRKKPISVHYKNTSEIWYNENRNQYEYLVDNAELSKDRFFIKNDGQTFRLIYETYSQVDEKWRLEIYKLLKKIGQKTWNSDLEEIEGIILGYRGIYGSGSDSVG